MTGTRLLPRRMAGLTLAAVLAVATAAPGLAEDVPAPSKLASSGELTYGVAATFAPFEYSEEGELKGFDIEMGAALAEKMGLEVNARNMEFAGLIPALQSGRLDIINSAMYIKPEREEQVDFVRYMTIGNEIVVPAGNPKGISSRDDLCGLRVAVTLGGIQESYAREDDEKCKAAGKDGVEVLTFPTAQDSALAVARNRADAFFNSTPGATMQVTARPDTYEIVGETFAADTFIGIAVRKDDAEMKKAIEAALEAIVADGTYDALIEKYKLPPTVSLF